MTERNVQRILSTGSIFGVMVIALICLFSFSDPVSAVIFYDKSPSDGSTVFTNQPTVSVSIITAPGYEIITETIRMMINSSGQPYMIYGRGDPDDPPPPGVSWHGGRFSVSLSHAGDTLSQGINYVHVTATDTAGGQDNDYWSFFVDTPAPPTDGPDVPSGLSATDGAFLDKVTIAWNTVSGATHYELYRSTSASGTYSMIRNTGRTSYDDTDVDTCKLYWYKVKACNASGCSRLSSSDFGFAGSMPNVPSGVRASDGTYTDKIRIMWDPWPPGSEISFFNIYRSASEFGSYSEIGESNTNSYDDTAVTPGRTYWYKVNAVNACGGSDRSAADSGFVDQVLPLDAIAPTIVRLVGQE